MIMVKLRMSYELSTCDSAIKWLYAGLTHLSACSLYFQSWSKKTFNSWLLRNKPHECKFHSCQVSLNANCSVLLDKNAS